MKNLEEIKEFIERVENASRWDDIDAEEYAEYLNSVDLDYSDYDDPDNMWEDFISKVKKLNKKYAIENICISKDGNQLNLEAGFGYFSTKEEAEERIDLDMDNQQDFPKGTVRVQYLVWECDEDGEYLGDPVAEFNYDL